MKKLFLFIATVTVFSACFNKTNNNATSVNDQKGCTGISVDSFLIIAGDYVDKEITVKGTVDHVCKHGGKRVKIFSSSPSKFIHGEATETVGAFKAELEGSDGCFTGTVLETKIDMAYVDEWEAKETEAIEKNADESEMEHKEGVDHHAKLDQIKKYREKIEASEQGYISFYALNVTDYHDCDNSSNEGCGKSDSTSSEVSVEAPCGDKKANKPCCSDKEKKAEEKPCGDKKQ